MQRKFITNLLLLLFLNFLIKPFWIFGIDRTVQNTVSENEYGIYFALFNFSMLFNIFLDLGITTYNNRNISQHKHLLAKYFSGIVVFKFLLAVVYFIVTFAVGYFVGYASSEFWMLLFLTINQFLISFVQYLRSNLAGLHLFAIDSLLSVLDKTLMIAFCAVLLWGNVFEFKFELIQFVYAQTLAYSITLLVVFAIVLAKSKQFKFKLDKSFSLMILKETYPYALLVLTMTFYYRMDAIMLERMLDDGERQASIYAQAYRLMDASNQIGVLFAALLLPMFAKMIKQNERLDELVKLSFGLLFVPAVILAIFSFFCSTEIMNVLYHSNTFESAHVLQVLMSCFVAIGTTYIFGTLLTANGSLKVLNQLAIGGVVLNFILNFVLIPSLKAEGSAYASLITQILIVFFQIIIAKKLFNFKLNIRYLVALMIFVSVLILQILAIKYYVHEFSVQLLVFVAISIISAIITKVVNLKELYKILINREL